MEMCDQVLPVVILAESASNAHPSTWRQLQQLKIVVAATSYELFQHDLHCDVKNIDSAGDFSAVP